MAFVPNALGRYSKIEPKKYNSEKYEKT